MGKEKKIVHYRFLGRKKNLDTRGLGQGKKWDMLRFGEEAHPNFLNAHDSLWGPNFSHNGYLYLYFNPFEVSDWENGWLSKTVKLRLFTTQI